MGRILLCVGERADTPYIIEKLYVNVYTAEELCYCLVNNAFLLDREIADRRLAEWLGGRCGLPELERQLEELLEQRCPVEDFVEVILQYVGYSTPEEIRRTKEILHSGVGMNLYEKKKARADFFLRDHKYYRALREYDELLEELPGEEPVTPDPESEESALELSEPAIPGLVPEPEQELRGKIWHNKGTANAGLFLFEAAACCYYHAYQLFAGAESGEEYTEEAYLEYLAARRLQLGEKDYIGFAAGNPQSYEPSLKLERRVEQARNDYEKTAEYAQMRALHACRAEGDRTSYYEDLDRITVRLREEYREDAGD